MKTIAFLLCFVLSMAGCASNPLASMRPSALHLSMDDGSCSATAVGKHVLLTAAHCLAETKALAVDGAAVKVVRIVLDGRDHALVVVDRSFDHWAKIGAAPS